jgi:hypothetical protein
LPIMILDGGLNNTVNPGKFGKLFSVWLLWVKIFVDILLDAHTLIPLYLCMSACTTLLLSHCSRARVVIIRQDQDMDGLSQVSTCETVSM